MPILGAIGHESVTVAGTAIGITATPQDGVAPFAAVITVEGAQISFTVDGTTPTPTVGHQADPGDVIELVGRAEVSNFRAIRTGGVSATLKVTPAVEYVA